MELCLQVENHWIFLKRPWEHFSPDSRQQNPDISGASQVIFLVTKPGVFKETLGCLQPCLW